VCCIATQKLISRESSIIVKEKLNPFLPFSRGEVCCIATQKLISRENSIVVKEKLNPFLPLKKGRLGGDVLVSR